MNFIKRVTRCRRSGLLAAAALTISAVVALCPPAATAASWIADSPPSPSGVPDATLTGISCATPTSCFAAGSYATVSGLTKTFIQQWNGTSWVVKKVPNPGGSAESSLRRVSCPTTTMCMAVGSYTRSDTGAPLAVMWNGLTWAIQAPPLPTGAIFGEFSDVSCAAATNCVAVGSFFTGNYVTRTLTARWNGTVWSVIGSVNPAGYTQASLKAVACTATNTCMAVGSYSTIDGTFNLAESFNGSTWTQRTAVTTASALTTELKTVSCVTATLCVAGGSTNTGSGDRVATQKWNGTTWSAITTPQPNGSTKSFIDGISCPSTTYCIAVGSWTTTAGQTLSLAERWNGTSWTVTSTPNRASARTSSLNAVRCTSTTNCQAAGTSGGPVTATWNGTAWALGAIPAFSARAELTNVTCLTTTNCFAVGRTTDSTAANLTLIERWDGATWTKVTSPTPSGAATADLHDISCVTGPVCMAVGTWSDGTTPRPFALRGDGVTWSLVTVGSPAGALGTTLEGVSCVSTSACFAVGNTQGFDGEFSFATRWNGTSWTRMTTPTPSTAIGIKLAEVSCTSLTNCISVGSITNSSGYLRTFTMRWNGTSWSVMASPNPTGTVDATLNGVSCVSSSTCMAVGSYQPAIGEMTTAMRWTGSSWILIAAPNPTGAFASTLRSVSCTSATACTAVGFSYDGSRSATIAQQWNGTAYTIVTTPSLSSASDLVLVGVSCRMTTSCVAVGGRDVNGSRFTLAERYL